MKPTQLLLGVAAAAGIQFTAAATPPGSSPKVQDTFGVVFDNNIVQPGETIAQSVVDAGQPTLYAPNPLSTLTKNLKKHKQPSSPEQPTYLFTMVDLSLPFFALPNTTDFASLVPGIGPNRTTRLHWFEYNVHASLPFLELKNFSTPVAEYEGPMPPVGDGKHDYVLYLFEQPEGYVPDAAAMAAYADESGFARMNFSVEALSMQVGPPVAANYFLVENANDTA